MCGKVLLLFKFILFFIEKGEILCKLNLFIRLGESFKSKIFYLGSKNDFCFYFIILKICVWEMNIFNFVDFCVCDLFYIIYEVGFVWN